jgi:hypothetical protein
VTIVGAILLIPLVLEKVLKRVMENSPEAVQIKLEYELFDHSSEE